MAFAATAVAVIVVMTVVVVFAVALAATGKIAVEIAVEFDRATPAVVGRHHAAFQAVEFCRARFDAEASGHRAPALTVVALPEINDVAAGMAAEVGERAGEVDIARCPAPTGQQLHHQIARRGVIAHQFVDERIAIAVAVAVHVAQPGVDPDVAAARVPAEREVLRVGAAGGKAEGEQCGGEVFAHGGKSSR